MTGIYSVGSGHTAFGRFNARSLEDLIDEATREARVEAMLTGTAGRNR